MIRVMVRMPTSITTAKCPPAYQPNPDDPGAPQILVRCDSAGATHTFAGACRTAGVGFSDLYVC
jgi:hypothetical protein